VEAGWASEAAWMLWRREESNRDPAVVQVTA